MVGHSSHVPLYIQIGDDLRARISDGRLRSGDKLPSEKELAESFDVARMTARKGLDALVAEGIVFRQPGKGTFVADPRISHEISTTASFSAVMQQLGLEHETRVLQAALVPAPRHVAEQLGVDAGETLVRVERLRLVDGAPAAIHVAWMPRRLARILEQQLEGSLTQLLASVGVTIRHARDTVEAGPAAEREAELLSIEQQQTVVRVLGVGFDEHDLRVRVTEAVYPADRFRFTVDTQNARSLQVELVERPAV
jgi:GntR family transcriptional regulator